ncbi:PO11 protein, partial [Pseudoatta argentina]
MDANARSPLWQSEATDERGLELEGFLLMSGWFVVNEDVNSHTFASTNGVSNIDVTLSSLYSLIGNWQVEVGWTNSDHRVLRLSLLKTDLKRDYIRLRKTYTAEVIRVKNQSWKNFVSKEGNHDTYGLVYKIKMKRIIADEALSCINSGMSFMGN